LLNIILIFVVQYLHFCWTASSILLNKSSFLLDSIPIFVEQYPHFCWTASSFLLNSILIFVSNKYVCLVCK
jgi:hypothetical protein